MSSIDQLRKFFAILLLKLRHPRVKFVRPRVSIGTYYSQAGQDLYMSGLLFPYAVSNPGSVVVDVGANHPVTFSNSLFFEKHLGCKTLAIDPLSEMSAAWKQLRPGAMFCETALGSIAGVLTLRVPMEGSNMFASVSGVTHRGGRGAVELREVKTRTLTSVLREYSIRDVLLLSIDVEGHELEVLKGIDFDNIRIKAILLENNRGSPYGGEDVRRLLRSKGFVFHARISAFDDVFLCESLVQDRQSSRPIAMA